MRAYSYGDSTGIEPVSLLILFQQLVGTRTRQEANVEQGNQKGNLSFKHPHHGM